MSFEVYDDDQGPENGIDLKFWAKLGKDIGEMNARGDRQERRWLQRATDAQRDVLIRFSATIASGGTVPTTLMANSEVGGTGPEPGEVWILRAVRVGGVTPTTTAAGRADLYQSVTDPNMAGGTGNTANWVDQATTLPLVGTYSNRQVVLRSPDNFFIVVTNGTAGQQYVANAQFEVYKDGGYRAEVEL
jgi:hypothetical protein